MAHRFAKGQPHGDRGRSLGGKAHAATNTESLGDDSNRTRAQYWGQVGWMKLIRKHGREGAGRVMAQRQGIAWENERREYSRYLGEMREANGD